MLDNALERGREVWNTHKYKILAATSFLAAGYFAFKFIQEEGEPTKWSSLVEAIRQHHVTEIVVDGDAVFFRSDTSQWFKTYLNVFQPGAIWNLVKDTDVVFSEKEDLIPREIFPILGTCLMSVASFKYFMTAANEKDRSPIDLKGSISGAKTYLRDYYGGEDIKEKFRETIDFLDDPQKYEEMGARIRRGILFYGPPGTGKTMLARALATEAGCQFIRVVASQFQQLYVGVGPKRIRELFNSARRYEEGCIIFIDEIDALGSRANHLRDSHETTTTINQFLSEMDGFLPTERVVVVAATNRLDLVDEAVLRSGRFDVKVHIPLPDVEQLKGILWKILDHKLGALHRVNQQAVNIISESAHSWCGADLESLVNETIYRAIAEDSPRVESRHLLQAYSQINELK